MNPGGWWRDGVIYEIYARGFAGGDGTGNRAGIGHCCLGNLLIILGAGKGFRRFWCEPT
ncbi:MAG: hypothetical protein JO069_09605 [Verrucomicrobia bacterium]|nr:hypothetical protein [Verrucomicrobiota bacterium]